MARRRVNLRFLVLLIVVLAVAGGGLLGLQGYRSHRRRRRAETGRTEGLAAYDAGDWETARTSLGQYLAIHRNDVDLLWKYADAQRRCDKPSWEQIDSSLRALLLIDPDHWQAQLLLAQYYGGVSAQLRHKRDHAPETLKPGEAQALRHYESRLENITAGMFRQQLKAVEEARENDPDAPLPEDLRLRFLQAARRHEATCAAAGRPEQTAEVLASQNRHAPGDVGAWYRHAMLQRKLAPAQPERYLAGPHCAKAERLMDDCLVANPGHLTALALQASLLAEHTRLAQRIVARRGADAAGVPERIGQLASRGYDRPVKIIDAIAVADLGSEHLQTLEQSIVFWSANARLAGARGKLEAAARRLLALAPDQTAIRVMLAHELSRSGRRDDALKLVDDGMALPEPQGRPAFLRTQLAATRVYLLCQAGRLDAAAAQADRMQADHPDEAFTALARAMVKAHSSRPSEALALLNGLDIPDNTPMSRRWRFLAARLRIDCTLATDRPGLALDHLQQALDLADNPAESIALRLKLVELRLRLGQLGQARAGLRQLSDMLSTDDDTAADPTDQANLLVRLARADEAHLALALEVQQQRQLAAGRRSFDAAEKALARIEQIETTLPEERRPAYRLRRIRQAVDLYQLQDRQDRLDALADSFATINDSEPETALLLADIERRIGRLAAARTRLARLAEKHPEHWTAAYALADLVEDPQQLNACFDRLQNMVGKTDGAARATRAAALLRLMERKKAPRQRMASLRQIVDSAAAEAPSANRVYGLLKSAPLEQARAAVERFVKDRPAEDPDRLLLEGMLLARQDKPVEAATRLAEADRHKPDWPLCLLEAALVKVQLAQADRRRAAELAVTGGDFGPDYDALNGSAEAFLQQAAALLERAVEINPLYREAEALRYRVALMQEDLLRAEASLKRLTDRFGAHPEVLALRVDDLLRKRDVAAAAALQQHLVDVRPDSLTDRMKLLALAERLGQTDQADRQIGILEKELDANGSESALARPAVFDAAIGGLLARSSAQRDAALARGEAILDRLDNVLPKDDKPRRAALALARARLEQGRGNLDNALRHARSAAALLPGNPAPLLAQADIQARKGEPARSLALLRDAAGLDHPGAAGAELKLAEALLNDRDGLAEADRRLAGLSKTHPGDPNVLLLKARLTLRQADADSADRATAAAMDLLRKVLRVAPGNESANGLLARLLLGSGRTDDAATVLDAALARLPDSVDLPVLRAQIALRQRQPARAAEILQQAVQRIGARPQLVLALAGALRAADPQRAYDYLAGQATAAEDNEWKARLLREMAVLCEADLKKTDLADGHLAEACRLTDNDRGVCLQRIGVLVRADRLSPAERLFDELSARRPDDLALKLDYAQVLFGHPQATAVAERVIALCGEVIKADPKQARAYFIRGDQYNRTGSREKAAADYRAGLAISPQPGVANNLAWLLYEMKSDREEAIKWSEDAIRGNPRSAEAWDTRRAVLLWSGKPDEAAEAARQSVTLNPKPRFRLRLAEALAEAGRHKQSQDQAASLRKDQPAWQALTEDQKARLAKLLE